MRLDRISMDCRRIIRLYTLDRSCHTPIPFPPPQVWFYHSPALRGFKSPPVQLHQDMLKLHASLKVRRAGVCACVCVLFVPACVMSV